MADGVAFHCLPTPTYQLLSGMVLFFEFLYDVLVARCGKIYDVQYSSDTCNCDNSQTLDRALSIDYRMYRYDGKLSSQGSTVCVCSLPIRRDSDQLQTAFSTFFHSIYCILQILPLDISLCHSIASNVLDICATTSRDYSHSTVDLQCMCRLFRN